MKGDRGEQGEMGPRGLQGQPGKTGDSYFTYNENRNLSYNKGGISIGKDSEITGGELLHIGAKGSENTRVVLEGDEIVFEFTNGTEGIRQTIKNNTFYWENGCSNFMNRVTMGKEKISVNIPMIANKLDACFLNVTGEINGFRFQNSTIENNLLKISGQELSMSGETLFKLSNQKIISGGKVDKLNKDSHI